MNLKDIKTLIDHIAKSGLQEVDIETEELKIAVRRSIEGGLSVESLPSIPVAAPAAMPAAPAQITNPAATEAPAAAPTGSKNPNHIEIKCPMIGTYYSKPNPDSDVFVAVGQKVNKGDTLCIVEAMKLFNEIEAEVSGTIVEILVSDSTPVEFDQVLFIIDPS